MIPSSYYYYDDYYYYYYDYYRYLRLQPPSFLAVVGFISPWQTFMPTSIRQLPGLLQTGLVMRKMGTDTLRQNWERHPVFPC